MVGWGTVQRGDPESCPQGVSALGLDLVYEGETESSLKGCPTPKHLGLGRQPPLKEFHVSHRRETSRGRMGNTGEAASWARNSWRLVGPCNIHKAHGVCPGPPNLTEGRSGLHVNWVVTGQEQMLETWTLSPEAQGDPQAGPLPAQGSGEAKAGLQPPHPGAECLGAAHSPRFCAWSLPANSPGKGVSDAENL